MASNVCGANAAICVQLMMLERGFAMCHIICAGLFVQSMLPDCPSHISSLGASNPAAAPGQLQASGPHRPSPCSNDEQAQPSSQFPMSTARGSGTPTSCSAMLSTKYNMHAHSCCALPPALPVCTISLLCLMAFNPRNAERLASLCLLCLQRG